MREFFQKHGSTLIFIVVMLVCLGFFVRVLALQNGFSSSVNAQAVERAEYHTDRQSMSVKRQTDAVKTKVALFAQTLDGITDARTAADKVRIARTSDYFAGEMFADIMYYADGKLYDYNDEQVTVYPGLAELADAETTMLTGAFQFDNRLMSVGVYAPVSEGALSGIVAVYDVNVLWASDLSQKDNTSVSASEFVLLCRSDGQILRRMTNTDTFDVGPEPVQSGFLSAYVTDETEYKSLTKCIANGTDGSDFSQYDFWNAIPDTEGRLMKCEGYLFPDTYEFFTDDSVYNYVNTFYKEFDAKTSDLWDTINEKGTTMNDVVILASFIQEEAGMPAEDAKVSACFHNRLESDDPQWAEHKLESNASSYIMNDSDNNYLWNSPTAAYYGWPEQGAIPDDVLALYDTYSISGLPAGAITNPGIDAIAAALNPDQEYLDEGYYFFVTGNPNGDHPGEYFYAKTADEHHQNCIIAGWG